MFTKSLKFREETRTGARGMPPRLLIMSERFNDDTMTPPFLFVWTEQAKSSNTLHFPVLFIGT